MSVMKARNRTSRLRCGLITLTVIVMLWGHLTQGVSGGVQGRSWQRNMPGERRAWAEEAIVKRATSTICAERLQDQQGTVPIDEMAAQPALPLTDPQVREAKKRAERLLSDAKKLVPAALSRLAAAHDLEALNRDWIVARAKAVNTIKAEVEQHDNAAWRASEPRAIIFGTVLLAGLRSDEAMITVLAHELTHAINGSDHALQPLIARVGASASRVGNLSVRDVVAAELTCELVGVGVVREYLARRSSDEALRRRLARALGKNCVRIDLADETHLSPRETMRLLLTLEPEFTKSIVEVQGRQAVGSRQ